MLPLYVFYVLPDKCYICMTYTYILLQVYIVLRYKISCTRNENIPIKLMYMFGLHWTEYPKLRPNLVSSLLFFFFFLAAPMACANSWARDQTHGHSSNPSRCSDTKSLTYCATKELLDSLLYPWDCIIIARGLYYTKASEGDIGPWLPHDQLAFAKMFFLLSLRLHSLQVTTSLSFEDLLVSCPQLFWNITLSSDL